MSASRHELDRILITDDIKYYGFFCILLQCCKSRKGTVGKVGNKQNDKTDFIREQMNIKNKKFARNFKRED